MRKIVRLIVLLLLASPWPASPCEEDTPARALPASIATTADLQRLMVAMRQASPTFRRQLQRLETAGLRVEIRRDPGLPEARYRARTTISRMKNGEVLAVAVITAFGDPTEWLAHEIEHVIEQLDGVKLARAPDRDAWPTSDGMFESWRAIRAGQIVKGEMRDSKRAAVRAAADRPGLGDD